MNKKIIAIALLTIMVSATSAFALPTQSNAQSGGSIPPIVKAKAEWLPTIWDDDAFKPYLQINPSGVYGQSKLVYYLVVATDLDGYDDLSSAYADVYHPNECWKYQVAMPNVLSCTDRSGELETWIGYLGTLDAKHLLTFAAGYDLDDLKAELRQCSAKLFYGTAEMDYCQMCGQFTWQSSCQQGVPNCTAWTASDFDEGYRVDAYVYDKTGAESPILTNYFEYICQAGLETDFNKLDFESVRYQIHKWIEGDRVWDSPGPACRPVSAGGTNSLCIAPTFRNIGNMPLTGVNITQDDMQFGYSGPSTNKDWNVIWDARIGNFNEHPVVVFDPYQEATAVGAVDLCELDKISFSIFVEKMANTGSHTGTVSLEPIPATFPWWSPDSCDEE